MSPRLVILGLALGTGLFVAMAGAAVIAIDTAVVSATAGISQFVAGTR